MQNNSLCVEEPFNTSRNLGNTADEATVKGLQLEFRRAVHYLADHASLELACWPYQFPTSENPRPERHLPNLPPQYRSSASNNQYNNNRKKQYSSRPQGSSPPFKSPKTRAEDGRLGGFHGGSSFGGSRQQYPFNPLNLNPVTGGMMPIPSTPQSSMSSAMSPSGDMHHAYPPTPVDQLHYIDPFKGRLAYYIPAYSSNGLPLIFPYSDDSVVYASPPQTPAMSETSLSHQPQYPRSQQYVFPQQYSRGQSVQRGRTPHRVEDVGSPTSGFRDPSSSLTGIGINTSGMSSITSPYIPTQMKRRNSLPPNNKPNVASHPVKSTTPSESFTPNSSITSQGLAGSMSSVVDSDVFEEDFFDRGGSQFTSDATPPSSDTPRPTTEKPIQTAKSDVQRSPGQVKDGGPPSAGGGLPAGKSYAAALLNTAPTIKSPVQPTTRKDSLATPAVPLTNGEKRKSSSKILPPISIDTSSTTTTTAPSSPPRKIVEPVPSSSSPVEANTRASLHAAPLTVWTNGLHPLQAELTSPVAVTRRPSMQSIVSNSSPKKSSRIGGGTRDSRSMGAIIQIPSVEPSIQLADLPTPPPPAGKKNRKNKKSLKKKETDTTMSTSTPAATATTNGVVAARRQSVVTSA